MVSRVQCRGACPSHTVTFCRPCPYPPSGGKCLVGRAERAQCVSPAPARRQGGLSVTSVLGRGEIGRLATAGAAVVPITTSLSLGTSSRFRDEPAHPPDGCISASKAAPHIWLKLAACARVSIEGGPAYMAQAGGRRQPKWSAISQIRWSQPPNLPDVSAGRVITLPPWPFEPRVGGLFHRSPSPICCPRRRRWRTAARLARRQYRRMTRLVGCVDAQPTCALALMPRRRRSRPPSRSALPSGQPTSRSAQLLDPAAQRRIWRPSRRWRRTRPRPPRPAPLRRQQLRRGRLAPIRRRSPWSPSRSQIASRPCSSATIPSLHPLTR